MAAHLRGYLVPFSGGDRLRSATRAGGPQPRERIGAPLLIDGTSNVVTAAPIAGTVEHAVSYHTRGAAQA